MYSQLIKKEVNSNGEPVYKGPFLITKPSNNNVYSWKVTGQWTNQENLRYGTFICQNSVKLQGRKYSKIWKVFQDMAAFVKTRNERQCKSHHQKMIEQFGSIACIASHLGLEVVKKKKKQIVKQEHVEDQQIFMNRNPVNITFSNRQLFIGQSNPLIIVKPLQAEERTAHKYKTPQFYIQSMKNNIMSSEENIQMMQSYLNGQNDMFGYRVLSQREEQWIECHRIFVLWYNKLAKLTSFGTCL